MSDSEETRGRPTLLTPETVTKLEQAFALDATVEEACFYADISRNTYYRWIKENPELSDKFDRVRQQPVLKARKTVVDALGNDPMLAFKYLERKKKDEFGARTELVGANGDPLIPAANDALEESVNELKRAVDVAIGQAETDPNVGDDARTSETNG